MASVVTTDNGVKSNIVPLMKIINSSIHHLGGELERKIKLHGVYQRNQGYIWYISTCKLKRFTHQLFLYRPDSFDTNNNNENNNNNMVFLIKRTILLQRYFIFSKYNE